MALMVAGHSLDPAMGFVMPVPRQLPSNGKQDGGKQDQNK
jgi:hypothetical protein